MRLATLKPRVAGFTLVELLVVIGIIGVLVAILMPALQKARVSAVRIQCMSVQRQITTSVFFYANDNQGKWIPIRISSNSPWPWYASRHLGKYLGNTVPFASGNYMQHNSRMINCPMITPNGWDDLIGIGVNETWYNGLDNIRLSKIRDPAMTLAFADVKRDGSTVGLGKSYQLEQLYYQDAAPRSWNGSGRAMAYRHGKSAVVAFFDGHVESFTVPKLEPGETSPFNQGFHRAYLEGKVKYKSGRD